MKSLIIISFLLSLAGCKFKEIGDYRVNDKDSANFSVFVSMLYPKERLLVKINEQVILDQTGDEIKGSPQSYIYFNYPDTIKKISVSGNYKGHVTFERLYVDTLLNVSQRSLIISFPFPKGRIRENYKPYGFIPIESSDRNIFLVDDSSQYKDTWEF